MPRPPVVSVAMCLFNRAHLVHDALSSVFAQTYADYEVVIVDDGSSDGGAEEIEARYPDRPIRIVRQAHQGLTMARRASIAASAGEFVAFLDSDDLWEPGKLEEQVTTARRDPSLALLSSDCLFIDEQGRPCGQLSRAYRLESLDLESGDAYAELLRKGCFVWQSTVMARAAVLRAVSAYDPAYQYASDYDTWLRIARRYRLHYSPSVLARWRMHPQQFTNRVAAVALADQRRLLGPVLRAPSVPRALRHAVGDHLLGQHRIFLLQSLRQERYALAARTAFSMFAYPGRMAAFALGAIAETPPVGSWLLRVYKSLRSRLRKAGRAVPQGSPTVWVDGSVLSATQAGSFVFVAGFIRRLLADRDREVHVIATRQGRERLVQFLGTDARLPRFHSPGGFALRSWQASPNAVEVIMWRGRFRLRGSRRIAVIQDLTTKLVPDLHTQENVAEFDRYLCYVQRRAHEIVTVSEHTRRDVIRHVDVFPASVATIPMTVHPIYARPAFDRSIPTRLGVSGRYILCVGSIEPRKNLRRLVDAMGLLTERGVARDVTLVLAGPPGWDDDFARFLSSRGRADRVRTLGFVPLEQLPSLFHHASAVAYPSLYEGFGLPVFEAMCCSSVVVTSNISALPEVLGEDGILVDPHSVASIAFGLERALSLSPEDAQDYRARCRRRAEALLARFSQMPILPGLRVEVV